MANCCFYFFCYKNESGIKAVDKKEGAGKGNWGTAVDELAAELAFFFSLILNTLFLRLI